MSGSLIEARGLTKHYEADSRSEGVDLTVNEGEVVGFIGQNGAGKSTTIKALLGLFPVPTAARRSVLGAPKRRALARLRRGGEGAGRRGV